MNNPNTGHFVRSLHGKFIRDFITSNPDLEGKVTRLEIADEFHKSKGGYKITAEQVRAIQKALGKTKFTARSPIRNQYTLNQDRAAYEAEKRGINYDNVSITWLKDNETSFMVKNDVGIADPQKVIDDSIAAMSKHSPKYPKIKRTKITDPHLLIVDPADVHIGKLALAVETGTDYNIQIAKQRCIEGVEGLIQKSNGFPIEKVILVIGNDILHFDTPSRKTTSGTPQDTDGQLHQIYLEGLDLYVQLIERLMQVADVEVIYNPSNHDYMSGYMLAQTVAAWFRKSKHVSFDVSISHRKYTRYGQNLIATSHGDGAKHNDMPMLMAAEAKDWSDTKFRYIYLHHLHHKKVTRWQSALDVPGVTMQILRSPSAPDGWHDRNGYTQQPMAVEGFIHHKEKGQVASLTHYF